MWKDKQIALNVSKARADELQGRPDITLRCGRGLGNNSENNYVFDARDSGPVHAVNVFIHDIVLPMSAATEKNCLLMDEKYTQTGHDPIVRHSGWNKRIVHFDKVDIPVHHSWYTKIPFVIENMGTLQRYKFHDALAESERPDGYILRIPVTLEFSNKDGATWKQYYELEHKLLPEKTGHLTLTYRRIERTK